MSDVSSFLDLTSILFTLFWLFFIGLVLHLHREGKQVQSFEEHQILQTEEYLLP